MCVSLDVHFFCVYNVVIGWVYVLGQYADEAVAGTASFFLTFLLKEQIVFWLQMDRILWKPAIEYLGVMSYGLFFQALFAIFTSIFRSYGKAAFTSAISVAANIGNIIGDILVVNGYLYVWGTVKDVALVTVGANAAASVAVFAVLWITDRDKVMQKPKQWDLKEILRLGIPAAMFAKNANLTFGNSLRAAGDVVYPVVISVMSMWGIGTGLAWVLGCVLDFGLVGIFAAFLIDETLRSFLLWHRWNRRVEGKLRLKGW